MSAGADRCGSARRRLKIIDSPIQIEYADDLVPFPAVGLWEDVVAFVEPIIVVLGPWCGGTSAVAGVLHHLGVFMGAEFDLALREPYETWEDYRLTLLCRRAFGAFNGPGGQLRIDGGAFRAKLRSWADEHRRAARIAGQRPGAKNPLLCLAVDVIREAWGPVVPVVVDRPLPKVVASLNRLGWLSDEQERVESTARLIAARDEALRGVATIRVDFEALRAAPAVVIRRLAGELCLEVTDAQLEAAAHSIIPPTTAQAGAQQVDPAKHVRDLLLAKVERNPKDARSVFLLAQTYFALGDFVNACTWYARRVEMGGWEEEVYFAAWQIAQSMAQLGAPWPDVQDAYLRAWEFRPTRAEPLYAIAYRYCAEGRYRLGYLFAQRVAEIPFPEDDLLVLDADIYTWRALDQQAACAFRIGRHAEAFTLWRRLLSHPDIPEHDRQRIARNRDMCVPTMIEAASSYPDAVVRDVVAGEAEVIVTLVAGPDRGATEQALNSFLVCCLDLSRAGRFLVVDAGLPSQDRAALRERYGFLEFAHSGSDDPAGAQLAQIRRQVHGRFWLHLGQGWRFFAPENLITRLTGVLRAEPQVFQVAINVADAATLIGACAAEQTVRRAPDAGRYLLTDTVARGPAMFDTTRLDRAGGLHGADPITAVGRRAAAAGLRTASLDEVLCLSPA
ncbi:tetratricopeptide repeat protein [Mycobacterium botniense]|uniref:Sulfotransferase family protein n=1 Tax=Mycobacterium botniense TaxID=84962 RepID=A0A7I9Y3N7_9MYCO|nr:hypothetical protein [Mycobacterium botniense]GFG76597.1 hypothetical protein MBOT_39620 [Mycobacterium botniense]